jgi:hypothetical protein
MIENKIDPVQYAEGFNQGMQAAAQRFELYIWILAGLFLLRIVIQLPWIRVRLEDLTRINLYQAFDTGTDVLCFFLVVVLLHALLGMPVIG